MVIDSTTAVSAAKSQGRRFRDKRENWFLYNTSCIHIQKNMSTQTEWRTPYDHRWRSESLGAYRRDLERHLGGLALPPDARVRDPGVVPHDVLAARLEREVRDEDGQDDLCACEADVNVWYCENSAATY